MQCAVESCTLGSGVVDNQVRSFLQYLGLTTAKDSSADEKIAWLSRQQRYRDKTKSTSSCMYASMTWDLIHSTCDSWFPHCSRDLRFVNSTRPAISPA